MAKRKSKKKNQKYDFFFYINILIVIVLLIIAFFVIDVFFLTNKTQSLTNEPQEKLTYIETDIEDNQSSIAQRFEEKTKELEIEYVDNDMEIQEEISKPKPTFSFEKKHIDIKKDIVKKSNIHKKIKKKVVLSKPKLAIIIDDVTNAQQVKTIQNIGFVITMAFLPPTKRHPNSAKITKHLKHYMIHLPLEAGRGSRMWEETDTLHISDSYRTIQNRIKQLHKWYPNTHFINNHTGSRFTANDKSMDKLMKVLKYNHFIFLDSRTTAKTVAKKYAKKYNVPYLSRNIFLDNKQDKSYIIKQLKKAINIAKKTGFAIAIGHPHKITLKTLKESKQLLKDFDLVYITSYKDNF